MQRKYKSSTDIIESAIVGGSIGAALGALLTGKSKNSLAAALLGAAIGASIEALKEAQKYNLPVLFEEDGIIYELQPSGEKKIIRKLKKSHTTVPSTFNID